MNKDLINKRFSRNLVSYNENAKVQKLMAKKLFDYIESNNFDSILEIGCGTGFLTELLTTNIEYNKYTAIDIVEECISYINNIDSRIQFLAEDIEEYLKKNDNKFDLIISNAALQWTENFELTVKTLLTRLKPNGILLFSTFGKENFREIYHTIGTSLKYYSKQDLEKIFSNNNLLIEEEIRITSFKTPKEVLKHLQATGVNAIEETNWTKNDLIKFEKAYNNICNSRPTLTYNPMYIRLS